MSDVKPPPDHVPPEPDTEPQVQESRLADNLKSRSTWLRLLFMILFIVLWCISRLVVSVVLVLQFLFLLFTGERNSRLAAFGQSLATYSYQLVAYLTLVTEDQPFPFSDWPDSSSSPS